MSNERKRYTVLADTHCHTNVSNHAHSTILEMVEGAKRKGLELISITNHGMGLPDSPHEWHFASLKNNVPPCIDGIKILKGVEANMMDYEGGIDMPEYLLERLDIVIASIHSPCVSPKGIEEHTRGWIKMIENPYVDILGHSGLADYPYDIDAVLTAAKAHNKWIEINNHTFEARPKSIENCRAIAKRCKELGVKMVVGSDAHFMTQVGEFEKALEMIGDLSVPEELIVNINAARLIEELSGRKPWLTTLYQNEGDELLCIT